MNRTQELYHAAHMLPDGPFSEGEIAELLQALFYICNALPEEHRPHVKAEGAYEFAWNQVNDRRKAG